MSGNLPIILIVVMWIFVLAPLFLRGQRPIQRTSEALDETHVVYTGGSGPIPTPRTRAQLLGARAHAEAASVGDSGAEEEFELVDDRPALTLVTKETGYREEVCVPEVVIDVETLAADTETDGTEVIDGEIVPDEPVAADPAATEGGEAAAAPVTAPAADVEAVEESYLTPVDLLAEQPKQEEELVAEASDTVAEESVAPAVSEESLEVDDETALTDEDVEFAAKRRGRGGFDPAADAANSSTRYQRRQRTFLALVALLVAGLVLGGIKQGMWWIVPVLIGTLLVCYLYALAKQVQAEKALRAQRIRHMRRARLGVRQNNADELGIPERLRTPAGVVVELDDDSADFAALPEYAAHVPEADALLQKVG